MNLPDLRDKDEFDSIGRMHSNRKYKCLALALHLVAVCYWPQFPTNLLLYDGFIPGTAR